MIDPSSTVIGGLGLSVSVPRLICSSECEHDHLATLCLPCPTLHLHTNIYNHRLISQHNYFPSGDGHNSCPDSKCCSVELDQRIHTEILICFRCVYSDILLVGWLFSYFHQQMMRV